MLLIKVSVIKDIWDFKAVLDNNIRTFKDLKAYEVGIRNRGVSDGKYKDEYRKSKYATELENEDESIYRKPTPEQLEEARRSFDELRKGNEYKCDKCRDITYILEDGEARV